MIRVRQLVAGAVMAVVVLGAMGTAWGNPWNIGLGADSANVIATLSGGTLTISGTGNMRNIHSNTDGTGSDAPYHSFKNSITNVVIKEGVTSIGSHAFSGYTNLTSVTIPEGVTIIGNHAFSMSGLTEVTIPNSVFLVASGAFMYCENLSSVTIGTGLIWIAQSMFMGCTRLTSIIIPDNVVHIGFGAFAVTGLTSIVIPSSVTHIDPYAFSDCNDLTSITVLNPIPPALGTDVPVFSNSTMANAILYVPGVNATLNAYKNHEQWGEFATILPLQTSSIVYGSRNRANSLMPTISVSGKTLNVKLPQSMQSAPTGNLQVRMIDMRGRTAANFNVVNGSDNSFSLTKMPAGSYIVEVRNAGGRMGSMPVVLR